MYEFSRQIYRALADDLIVEPNASNSSGRRRLLDASEAMVIRLAEHPEFSRSIERALFAEVRGLFPLARQWKVRAVIAQTTRRASHYLADLPATVDPVCGERRCRGVTRFGDPCRREPQPDGYCPSHRHLVEALPWEHGLESVA